MNAHIENKSADCVIFIHQDLGIGGIERYIYDQIIYLAKKNKIIVWICDKNRYIANEYKTLLNITNLHIYTEKIKICELKELLNNIKNPKINIITCYHDDFLYADKIRKQIKWGNVNIFYFLSHFCGARFFCEDIFSFKILNEISRKFMSQIYFRMYQSNALRFFSPIHSKIVEDKYKFTISNENDLAVPPVITENIFDENHFRKLFNRNEFNIITVSRLDFPHKGYVLGLIDAYAQIRKNDKNTTLTIVGDGIGMSKVKSKIKELPIEYQNNIKILGYLSPEQLREEYLNANINISVAGCCTLGATYGTLSAPARHYTYECEVYGYLPECEAVTPPEKKGYPVIELINDIKRMNEDEYIQKCRNGFINTNKSSNALSIDCIFNNCFNPIYTLRQKIFLELIYKYIMTIFTIKQYIRAIKKKGILQIIKNRFK